MTKQEEKIDWEWREKWYIGMGKACLKRHATFLTASRLGRVGEDDDGFEEAQKWFKKASLARQHIRSW